MGLRTMSRSWFNGNKQFNWLKYVRYITVSRFTVADQSIVSTRQARTSLGRYKFPRIGVFGDIAAVNIVAALHRIHT